MHLIDLTFQSSSEYRWPLMICILVNLSQQLSGFVAIIYYSTKFFITAGMPEESAQYSTIGVGAVMFIMAIVSSFLYLMNTNV